MATRRPGVKHVDFDATCIYGMHMPPKKQKKTRERHPITLRFDDNEMAALHMDRRELGGVPVSAGAYAKHAVLSYPRLRKLEEGLRELAESEVEREAAAAARGLLGVAR